MSIVTQITRGKVQESMQIVPPHLTIDEVLQNLTCAHAEADTALFTKLRAEGYSEAVVIDTEDTDNHVQAGLGKYQDSCV